MTESQTAPRCETHHVPRDAVDLEAYRVEHKLTWQELADKIGAKSAGQAQNWAQGEVRPSARRLDEIVRATGGRVSIFAMHQRRLAWEREHLRPVVPVDVSEMTSVCVSDDVVTVDVVQAGA